MICGMCGRRMKIGKFSIMGTGSVRVLWSEGDRTVGETYKTDTTGFFCENCGIIVGVFLGVKQVGFTSDYNSDIDDGIDILPKKRCPDCDTELDIDYPRCPECGYVF